MIGLCAKRFAEYIDAVQQRNDLLAKAKKEIDRLQTFIDANCNHKQVQKCTNSSIILESPTHLPKNLSRGSIDSSIYEFRLMSPVSSKRHINFNALQQKNESNASKGKCKEKKKKVHQIEKHNNYTKWHDGCTTNTSTCSSSGSSASSGSGSGSESDYSDLDNCDRQRMKKLQRMRPVRVRKRR